MSDERIDSIVNRAKVKSDLDFVDELLSSVVSKIEKINNIKVSIDGGKGLADVGKQAQQAAQATEQLANATGKLQAAETAMSQTLGNLDQSWRNVVGQMKENIKLQIQYESELKKVRDAIKEQNDAVKNTGSSYNIVSQKLVELKQRETELKAAISEAYRDWETDRKSTRLNSSHSAKSRMPSSA